MGLDKGGYYHPQFMKNNVESCKGILPLKKLTATKVEPGPFDLKHHIDDITASLTPHHHSDRDKSMLSLSQTLPYFPPEKGRYHHRPQHHSLQQQLDYKNLMMNNLEQEAELQTSGQRILTSSLVVAATPGRVDNDRNLSAVIRESTSSFSSLSHPYPQKSPAAVATEASVASAATSSDQGAVASSGVRRLLSLTGYEFPKGFDFDILEPTPFRSQEK
jgi:hypothetical protein